MTQWNWDYFFFWEITERSWRSLPFQSVSSPSVSWSSQAAEPANSVWDAGLWTLRAARHLSNTQCTATGPGPARFAGFKQIIAIMVSLRGRDCLPTPSKTPNMLGNGLEAVFALVLWEEVSVLQPQPAVGSCLQKQKKREQDERKEKKNELQQNVRVRFETHWS